MEVIDINYSVNIERIEQELYELAKIGYCEEDHGIYRQGFTETDMEGRRWLQEKLNKEGLTTKIDGAANVIGKYGDMDTPSIIIGSHIDTVPCGGMFDGALGVIAGLECIRQIKENDIELNYPIEIIATSEEEGRFGGMLGAEALTGYLTSDWLEKASDIDGEYLKDAMAKCNFDYRRALHAYRDPKTIKAFLELHIEQGPVLEHENKSIGIVEGISGVFKWIVKFIGKADHAGTAPMNMRSDAFMGLANFAHELYRITEEDGTDKSRLTIGQVELKPGFPHTIPGEVIFSLVGRDLDDGIMKNLASNCRKVLSSIARRHGLMFEYDEKSWLKPSYSSDKIMNAIEVNTMKLGYDYMIMPSGAGHDAQFFNMITDAGMIFVPSVKGVSHAPDEWTHWIDVQRGANVLLNTVISLGTE